MTYPLVRDLAAGGFAVAVTCRVLGFSAQGYNKWRRNPITQRDLGDAYLTNAAVDLHRDDPVFGYRLISDDLARLGFVASERRVWRICFRAEALECVCQEAGTLQEGRPTGAR
jgi:putative transposase